MFADEAEAQARRRSLTVLQDEVRAVLESARELSHGYSLWVKGDSAGLAQSFGQIRKLEDEAEKMRRSLTRELAEMGAMIMNREDVLRAAYAVEEIPAYASGICFRFTQVNSKTLKSLALTSQLGELVDGAVEAVHRLNEIVRALSISPHHAMDLANSVQKVEKEIDEKHRALIVRVVSEVTAPRDIIIFKDIVEAVENMADKCLDASDAVTILALGF